MGAENKSISSNDDSEDEYEDGGEVFDMPLQHAQEERKRHRKTVLKSVGVDINKNIIHDFQRVQITGQVGYLKKFLAHAVSERRQGKGLQDRLGTNSRRATAARKVYGYGRAVIPPDHCQVVKEGRGRKTRTALRKNHCRASKHSFFY